MRCLLGLRNGNRQGHFTPPCPPTASLYSDDSSLTEKAPGYSTLGADWEKEDPLPKQGCCADCKLLL